MVCDRDFQFKTICQSVFFVGHFVGALIAGVLADWFGRKRAFILILVPAIGIYLASYFVDNPYAWIVLRFFVGVANMAVTTVKSVYAVSSKFPSKNSSAFELQCQ
jgi:MFS family permease